MSELDFLSLFNEESQDLLFDICKRHPNPTFYRNPFLILNGTYKFEINTSSLIPSSFDSEIFVPYSINSIKSGINVKLKKNLHYHYHKDFVVNSDLLNEQVFLNIERINGDYKLFINGKEVTRGSSSIDIKLEIKKYLNEGQNQIDIDFTKSESKYLGITGSIYLDSSKENEIKSIKVYPDPINKLVKFEIDSLNNKGTIKIISPNGLTFETEYQNSRVSIDLNDNVFYFPNSPFFYQYTVKTSTDEVSGIFILSSFTLGMISKIPVFKINDEPYPIKGVINKDLYKDGSITFESYENIDNMFYKLRNIGFNSVLLKDKIELPYYYNSALNKGILIAHKLSINNYNEFINTVEYLSKYPINFLFIIKNKIKNKTNRDLYKYMKSYLVNSLIIVYGSKESFGDFELIKNVNSLKRIKKNNTKCFVIDNQVYKKDSYYKFKEFIKNDYLKSSTKGLIGFYYSSLSGIKDGLFDKDLVKINDKTNVIKSILNK